MNEKRFALRFIKMIVCLIGAGITISTGIVTALAWVIAIAAIVGVLEGLFEDE